MALKSAVELSDHRSEIDDFLKEGKSSRFISDWLKKLPKKEGPETISHVSISNYKKKKFNVKKEATIKYNEKKSKEKLKKASDKVVSDIEALDEIIHEGQKIKLDLDNIRPDFDSGVTDLDIENTKLKAKRLVIQAAKAKHDITKDEPTPVFLVKVEDVDAEEQRLIEETADNLARQTEDSESIESECEDES
jgi:hypothetical protein